MKAPRAITHFRRLKGTEELLDAFLDDLATRVRRLRRAGDVWVIFDNTPTRAAADNARSLIGELAR